MQTIYEVEIEENGRREIIEFEGPDGLSEQEIERLADSQLRTARPGQSFPAAVYGGEAPQQPQQNGNVPERMPQGMYDINPYARYTLDPLAHFGSGVLQGAAEVGDNAAELLQGGYNQTLGRVFGQSDSATRTNEAGQGFQGLADQLGQGSRLGHTMGNIGAATLLTRGMGAGAQGAGTGALLSDAESPGEFIGDVATGWAGGRLGDAAVRGAQSVLSPAIDAGARALRNAGTRLTPGQYLPALREFEDKAMSWPWIGPQLQRARNQGFEDFAVSIPRQALQTARQRLPGRNIPDIPAGANGQQAVRHTGDQLSNVYNDIIPRLRLQGDEQIAAGIGQVATRLNQEAITPAGRRQFERIVRNGVMGRVTRGQPMNGRQYQATDTYLEQQIARFGRSADPDHQAIAGALTDIRATLRNGVARQNGELGRQLEAVDEAWSMLVPAEIAASGAPRGFFSPAQYRRALTRGDNRVRRRGMARGEVRGQEMAEAGMDILPQQHPNYSGTASHEAYNVANTQFWQGLGARGLYGPGVQKGLERLTIGRPPALDPLAQAIARGLDPFPASQAGAAGALGFKSSLFGF